MNLLEALSLDPNEVNKKEHLDLDISLDRPELLNLINNDDTIDLLTIQANKILNDIKRMIGVKLKEERIKEIDNNFITSLKKMIVICNNEMSKEYLTELSYVYYATYNNTLNAYYELTETRNKIYYFMLDERFYNFINVLDEYDWNRYNASTLDMLDISYRNNTFDSLIEILKINPDFSVMEFAARDRILEKDWFNKLIEIFGIEGLAKGDMYIILSSFQEYEDYIKAILTINPNVIFSEEFVFEPTINRCFDIKRIAFFTEEDKNFLNRAYEEHKTYFDPICEYYNNLLEHIEGDNHRDFTEEIGVIEYLAINNLLPSKLYLKLTNDEIDELDELIKFHLNTFECSEFSFVGERNIRSFMKKINKKYGNQKQKKLKR